MIWDLTTQSQLLCISLDSIPLAIAFNESEPSITIAERSTEISTWSFLSKTKLSSKFLRNSPDSGGQFGFERVPKAIEISIENRMIAVSYRARPLLIYDLHSLDFLGACHNTIGVATGTYPHVVSLPSDPITSIAFNPSPEIQRLAVAYWEGDVALFELDSFKMVNYTRSASQTLTVSADGKTLAGGNSRGKIEIFDFETLGKIYSAVQSSDGVTAMSFTSDSRRLLDIRAYQVNVWEPSVLMRNFVDDNSSEPSGGMAVFMDETHISEADHREATITAIVCAQTGTRAICGKSNGAVDMYDVTYEDKASCPLYKSGGAEVFILDWNEKHSLVASGDLSGCFQVVRLSAEATQRTKATKPILKKQLDYGVSLSQLLISASGTRILVSSPETDQMWCLETGTLLNSYKYDSRINWKWFLHPKAPEAVVKVQDGHIQWYRWGEPHPLSQLVKIRGFPEAATIDMEHAILSEYNGTAALQVIVHQPADPGVRTHNARNTQLYNIVLPTFQSDHESAVATTVFAQQPVSRGPDIDFLIGAFITSLGGRLLIFMSSTGWICSIDLSNAFPHISFRRHFFVPFAWLSSSVRHLTKISERGDVLFVHGQEVAVAVDGLEEFEDIKLNDRMETEGGPAGKRMGGPSFLGRSIDQRQA